ncbi:MAG: DUF4386 domain-containing protein [Calditrichia bacterium]
MIDLQKTARLAGLGYLLIFITGIFSNFIVLEPLRIPDNIPGTLANFRENSALLQWALFSFLLMVLLDALLSWFFFLLFEKTNRAFSLLAAWFRLLNSLLFAVALVWLFLASRMAESPQDSPAETLFAAALSGFDLTWLIGLIFFAIHLALLAHLIIRSSAVPTVVGWLLGIAGLGYLVDSLAALLWPGYAASAQIFSMMVIIPAVVGELTFTFFLLLKSRRFVS